MNKFLRKLNRIAAYILIVLFVILMITGYRQVGYFTFITRGVASSLHQIYINIIFLVLFTFHSAMGIRIALKRNKVSGLYVDILLIILSIIFIAGFSYFTMALI